MRRRCLVSLVSALFLFAACSQHQPDPPAAPTPAPALKLASAPKRQKRKHRKTVIEPVRSEKAVAVEEPKAAEPLACPDGMVDVRGNFCRAVEEKCEKYLTRPDAGADENRCLEFERPTRCTSTAPEPRRMDFCMDRYEYPNEPGKLPMTLVSWTDAERICESQGKRLCTESEFSFACEGEEMRPYAYGFERDDKKCNIDKPYQTPRGHLLPYERCLANAACAKEFQRVDGREPIGSHPECVSPFGVFDMNGNANEWVSEPWKDPPHRAAIKGGWWGPVRNRCRAITHAHDESYMGYEVGFRCCKDATSADAGAGESPDAG